MQSRSYHMLPALLFMSCHLYTQIIGGEKHERQEERETWRWLMTMMKKKKKKIMMSLRRRDGGEISHSFVSSSLKEHPLIFLTLSIILIYTMSFQMSLKLYFLCGKYIWLDAGIYRLLAINESINDGRSDRKKQSINNLCGSENGWVILSVVAPL